MGTQQPQNSRKWLKCLANGLAIALCLCPAAHLIDTPSKDDLKSAAQEIRMKRKAKSKARLAQWQSKPSAPKNQRRNQPLTAQESMAVQGPSIREPAIPQLKTQELSAEELTASQKDEYIRQWAMEALDAARLASDAAETDNANGSTNKATASNSAAKCEKKTASSNITSKADDTKKSGKATGFKRLSQKDPQSPAQKPDNSPFPQQHKSHDGENRQKQQIGKKGGHPKQEKKPRIVSPEMFQERWLDPTRAVPAQFTRPTHVGDAAQDRKTGPPPNQKPTIFTPDNSDCSFSSAPKPRGVPLSQSAGDMAGKEELPPNVYLLDTKIDDVGISHKIPRNFPLASDNHARMPVGLRSPPAPKRRGRSLSTTQASACGSGASDRAVVMTPNSPTMEERRLAAQFRQSDWECIV
ncbi:hypothetical protein B0H67DRAFT_550023 [Lasiosphaeris hirsuta]|uniref:Uncharacterized protein n=1 Tax=Lasiosphaeris hirsuta TaxID=260670 RepID=A0AA40AY91_9PEZI|nr:hypothetical protein B0H67DRAFT_550023 [Lasiosphaeris hirsuta]